VFPVYINKSEGHDDTIDSYCWF